jgi:hypothetical protein
MAGDAEASCVLGRYRPSENRSLGAVTVQVSWCPMGAKTPAGTYAQKILVLVPCGDENLAS